jgi:dipeptidase D
MQNILQGLEPPLLWKHFFHISQIPRCSKNERQVRDYVIAVAASNGLNHRMDQAGNLLVRKSAAAGAGNKPIVVLQCHLDMVCEKNRDVMHDFTQDPIRLRREGDWLTADRTTLGADNGIGVAACLAIMEDKDVKHGPLELLFTVDEETGLSGAKALPDDLLAGRVMLNLDSEQDGVIYIGCAGGQHTRLRLNLETVALPPEYRVLRLRVGGLMGGHSGLNIHEGRGNAIKLLCRLLWEGPSRLQVRIARIDGGNKHNAIPRESEALICLPGDKVADLKNSAAEYERMVEDEYRIIDPQVFVRVDEGGFSRPDAIFTVDLQNRLLNLLYALPHGVVAMSHTVPGLVETSNNLAVVTMNESQIEVLTSQRSSVRSRLVDIVNMVCAAGRLADAEIHLGEGYPPWQPDPGSATLKVAKELYGSIFDKHPEIKAIHAGLECAIIGSKFPGMDMISLGPTILGAHSPAERVQVSTVGKFWDFLVSMLGKMTV